MMNDDDDDDEAKERSERKFSSLCFFEFFTTQEPTKEESEREREREESESERVWKSVNERQGFFGQKRFFSLETVKKWWKRDHTDTKERPTNVFPQHHIKNYSSKHQSSCSLCTQHTLTWFDHHRKRRMSPKLDLRIDRRWKSARWGWKKVRYCFRFRRRNPFHLVFKNGCSFSL